MAGAEECTWTHWALKDLKGTFPSSMSESWLDFKSVLASRWSNPSKKVRPGHVSVFEVVKMWGNGKWVKSFKKGPTWSCIRF